MEKFMSKLLELFEESIMLQGFITVAFVGTYCYKIIAEQSISDDFSKLVWTVLVFWFGTKAQAATSSMAKRLGNGKFGSNPSVASRNNSV